MHKCSMLGLYTYCPRSPIAALLDRTASYGGFGMYFSEWDRTGRIEQNCCSVVSLLAVAILTHRLGPMTLYTLRTVLATMSFHRSLNCVLSR